MNEPLRTTSRPVILMRPGEANNRLAELLEAQGIHAVRWPAFSIELPEETDHITERLSNLDDVEMVVLPSPASVAAAAHWVREWPEHITLATVGDASHSGSEALWPLVQAHGAPSRVLFLRGQTGREWLPEQFRRIGSDVVVLSTYIRVPLELTVPQLYRLEKAILGPSPLIYLTSTDAVDVLMHAVRPVPNARMWITRGKALTIHPRVESRLREAGFQSIELTSPDENEVIARIRESLAA